MAGATNKAMKSAGIPKATQEKIRVSRGAGLTVQSAIQHAQAHGLPLGKAAKHAGELTGWQKAAAGAVSPAEKAASRAAREAYVAAEGRKAAMRAALQKRAASSLDAASKRMLTGRLVSAMMSRQLAAQQAADAQKAAARPKFKGPGPFNPDRHKARAMALSQARKAQFAEIEAKRAAVVRGNPSDREESAMNRAYLKAGDAMDRAAALNRRAGARVSVRDAVRRGEKGTNAERMRQARSDMAGLRAPGKGQAHVMTADGPKTVDTLATSKNFFVHKEGGYGGQFVVSHRGTGMAVTQSNTLSGAKRIMDGMKKTGERTMQRLEQGGAAGERSARAMARYLRAPQRRNVSLAERGLRAGSAPTKRGKEANKAAGIRG